MPADGPGGLASIDVQVAVAFAVRAERQRIAAALHRGIEIGEGVSTCYHHAAEWVLRGDGADLAFDPKITALTASDRPAGGPIVAGQPAGQRLQDAIAHRARTGDNAPSAEQVAMVLHALADHTALQAAQGYRHDPSSPWPTSLSLGRWLHDTADQLERGPVPDVDDDPTSGPGLRLA